MASFGATYDRQSQPDDGVPYFTVGSSPRSDSPRFASLRAAKRERNERMKKYPQSEWAVFKFTANHTFALAADDETFTEVE